MNLRRLKALGGGLLAAWLLAACVSADPAVVARAVSGTLTAVITQTPVVVVVTILPPAGVPTASPAPATETPALMASPTAPPTLTAPPGPAPTGAPELSDDFSQPTGWTLAEDGLQKTALADGQLEFTVKEPDQFRFIYDIRRRGGDFFASVAASAGACQPRDRLGLLFRVRDGANYYQFEVDCAGNFRLAKVEADALTPLRDWAALPPAAAAAAGPRTLAVRAQGPALEAFVEGVLVAQVTDSAFAEGAFGLIVGSSAASSFTARFDDFQVWTLR